MVKITSIDPTSSPQGADEAFKQASFDRNFWNIFGWRTKALIGGVLTGILFGGLLGAAALAIPAIFGGIVSWAVVAAVTAGGALLGFNVYDHLGQQAGTATEMEHRMRKESTKTRAAVNNLTQQLGLQPIEESDLNKQFEPATPKPPKKLFSLKTALIFIALGVALGTVLALGGAGAGILGMLGFAAMPAGGVTTAMVQAAAAAKITYVGLASQVGIVAGFCGLVGASFGIGAHIFENIQRSASNVARGKLADAEKAFIGKDQAPIEPVLSQPSRQTEVTPEDIEKLNARLKQDPMRAFQQRRAEEILASQQTYRGLA